MKKQLLHPATLIATLALLVALEIPSDAARLIDGKLLKRGSVTRSKLSKGVRAQLDKAGQPGPAGQAGQAGQTGPKGDRGPAGAALSCPNGTALHELACIELAERAQKSWYDAVGVCQAANRRLPTMAELQTFRFRTDLNPPTIGSEWADGLSGTTGSEQAVTVRMTDGLPGTVSADGPFNFRCMASATVAAQ